MKNIPSSFGGGISGTLSDGAAGVGGEGGGEDGEGLSEFGDFEDVGDTGLVLFAFAMLVEG